jgi:hypothetical protein
LAVILLVVWLGQPLTSVAASSEPGESGSPLAPNILTADEQAAGWELLFNGQDTAGWRSFGRTTFPRQGWVVSNLCLVKLEGVRGGDILTDRVFDAFEFQWEWKLKPGGNNGVKYFIDEGRGQVVGHEYQMIDDREIKDPKGRTASFYDVLPPEPRPALKPPGEWNHSRLVVHRDRVEHWLNGTWVLAYDLGSPRVLEGVARSKFREVDGFGRHRRGHLLLTDHGSEAWFRNLKVRVLPQ